MSIRILLVDDHQMMRDGLRLILDKIPEVEIVGEAGDGHQAVELANTLVPDIVVMDIGMADLNGIEATRRILSNDSAVKIIALSIYSDRRYVLGMLEVGASAYVLKAATGDELVRAIQAVSANRKYLSPEIAETVVNGYTGRISPTGHSARKTLGPREREVLQQLSEGKSSSQIAGKMKISVKTVETHRRNIMRKLDLHSVAALTKYAVIQGLTQLEG